LKKLVDVWDSDIDERREKCESVFALVSAMARGIPALPEKMQEPFSDGTKRCQALLTEVIEWLRDFSWQVRYAKEVEE
jgi:hypothetical protein